MKQTNDAFTLYTYSKMDSKLYQSGETFCESSANTSIATYMCLSCVCLVPEKQESRWRKGSFQWRFFFQILSYYLGSGFKFLSLSTRYSLHLLDNYLDLSLFSKKITVKS